MVGGGIIHITSVRKKPITRTCALQFRRFLQAMASLVVKYPKKINLKLEKYIARSSWTCESVKNFIRYSSFETASTCMNATCYKTNVMRSEHFEWIFKMNIELFCKKNLHFNFYGVNYNSEFSGLVLLIPDSEQTYSIIVPRKTELYNVGVWCLHQTSQRIHVQKKHNSTNVQVEEARKSKMFHTGNYSDNENMEKYSSRYFQCDDLTFILDHHVCDGNPDCPGGDDENSCVHACNQETQHPSNTTSTLLNCPRSLCLQQEHYFPCRTDGCIPASKVCDCHKDCADASDESDDLCPFESKSCEVFVEKLNFANHTTVDEYMYQREGGKGFCDSRLHFLNVHMDCLDQRGMCKGGSFWQTPISLHNLCDHKDNCFQGEDEWIDCAKISISPLFRCTKEKKFVNFYHLIDGNVECPSSLDDERYCD